MAKIAVIGLCGESIFMKVDTLPKASVTHHAKSIHIEPGGKGYNQVVGHTPTDNIRMIQMENGNCLWLCDSLGYNNYLVIEDNIFESRSL